MIPPEFKTEVIRRAAEHEVFLGFNRDDEAVFFREWWEAEGFKLFEKAVQQKDL